MKKPPLAHPKELGAAFAFCFPLRFLFFLCCAWEIEVASEAFPIFSMPARCYQFCKMKFDYKASLQLGEHFRVVVGSFVRSFVSLVGRAMKSKRLSLVRPSGRHASRGKACHKERSQLQKIAWDLS